MSNPTLNDALAGVNQHSRPEPESDDDEIDDSELSDISGGLTYNESSCPSFEP